VEPAGTVRVSVGVSFGRHWVLPALPALAQAHPQLCIEVDLDNRPVDLVARGYDIGIRGGALKDSALVARRICRLPLVLVASPAYLKRAGVPEGPAELEAHHCVQLRLAEGALSTWRFRAPGQRRGTSLVPRAAIVVDDAEALCDLALADAGIAQCGLMHVLPFLRSGQLKLLLVDCHDVGDREFVLLYPHRQYLAPRVRAVVDGLMAHFRAAQDLHLQPAELPARFSAR